MRKSRPQTKETRRRISKSLTKYYPPFVRLCPDCKEKIIYPDRHGFRKAERGNCICRKCKVSQEKTRGHYSLMGRKSSTSQHKRSQNEKYFAELCQEHFDNVTTNDPMFNGWDADVIIHNKKVAVLWNGVWHYRQISKHQSVRQVKNRDKIKLHEIKKCGYIPYIIKDMGGKNRDFVEKKFDDLQHFLLTL